MHYYGKRFLSEKNCEYWARNHAKIRKLYLRIRTNLPIFINFDDETKTFSP